MNKPTNEQGIVLSAPDRVRIVRAAPGCGKTWLVAEAIRRELEGWSSRGGIAALSFTNVGGQEIRKAVGHDLGHPHFVGTLDKFVYRYIVRQFAHVLDPAFRKARLVPDDHSKTLSYDKRAQVQLGGSRTQPSSLFDFTFTGGVREQAILARKDWGRAIQLEPKDSAIVRAAKHKMWRDSGWMSHSDITYVAAAILRDALHGKRIREWLAARFPFIVVDELQDTGWYFSEIVRDLLGVETTRGLLVGDPDQAIYQFNGARPELFETFSEIAGSKVYPVRKSIRCPSAVAKVANYLISGKLDVEPRDGATGKAILLIADNAVEVINKARMQLAKVSDKNIAVVVTRGNDAIEELDGGKMNRAPDFASRPLTLAHDAARHLAMARSMRAIEAAKGAILYPLMGIPTASDLVLQGLQIDHIRLRLISGRLLESARPVDDDESAWDWGNRMKAKIIALIQAEGWLNLDGDAPTVKGPPQTLKTVKVKPTLVRPPVTFADSARVPVKTVHGVKGETHDTTIFYVPDPTGRRACVSEVWWSNDPAVTEERRVAFVASTRSRGHFVLCVSKTTANNLHRLRPDFFKCFDVQEAELYLASLAP